MRSGPRYHIGNGAASIRWVSESSAPSVWLSRSDSVGALLLAGAGVEQPQQDGARRLGRRGLAAAHLEHPARTGDAHLALERLARHRRRLDGGDQRRQIVLVETAVLAGEVGQGGRRAGDAKLAKQPRIGLQPAVGVDDHRPRRRDVEQPRHVLGRCQHRRWRGAGAATAATDTAAAMTIHSAASATATSVAFA